MPNPKAHAVNWTERIVSTGFRELAKKFHPDAGGTDDEFDRLHKAYTDLREFAKNGGGLEDRRASAEGVQLFLEMGHISTLLAGQPVVWTGPDGYRVYLRLQGGPGQLLADVVKNLIAMKKRR